MEGHVLVALTDISLLTVGVEHIYMCLFMKDISSLVKCSNTLLFLLDCLFSYWILRNLYIIGYKTLTVYVIYKYLLPVGSFSFLSLNVFQGGEFLILIESDLYIFLSWTGILTFSIRILGLPYSHNILLYFFLIV